MRGSLILPASFLTLFASARAFSQPQKVYGVNLGSWLVAESWMIPDEWTSMGGELCTLQCQDCISTEFALTKAYPDTADQLFDNHWQTWFTQADVQNLTALGINTVRIPLGYWIVEPLVEDGEYYPKGGMRRLKEGLGWLKDAGIAVILDHHALPGVAAANQIFAGQCTSDVQFYTPKNYHRALIWTAVMTFFSHVDPDFGSVFAIEAVNEPTQNASLTPGYGQFQQDFVQTIRAVEYILCGTPTTHYTTAGNFTATIQAAIDAGGYSDTVKSVLIDGAPVLLQMLLKYGGGEMIFAFFCPQKDALTTNFMEVNWQTDNPPNPADAKDGLQAYDQHLYYYFGGIADPTEEAYLASICNLNIVANATAVQNTPLWFGEWSLGTNFTATGEFLMKWADAQKLAYSKSAGWIFWNFKFEDSASADGFQNQWSYFMAFDLGYLTEDPSAYHNASVCEGYTKAS